MTAHDYLIAVLQQRTAVFPLRQLLSSRTSSHAMTPRLPRSPTRPQSRIRPGVHYRSDIGAGAGAARGRAVTDKVIERARKNG